MLRISKLTDYATVILSFLALDPDRIASATALAEKTHLSIPTVSKILKILSEAGLVESFRGTGGGYKLARDAREITIAEIVTAIEGSLAMTECCAYENNCAIDSLCAIKENWKIINKIILTALGGVTLSEMTKPLHAHPLTLRGIPIKIDTLKSNG
ncbi:MAG: SUF system Fe-S cluster assembly regulator [Gammaproteobacteria bacterium]